MPRILVEVRDGRIGRDPALVTGEGGEVLHRFETNVPVDVGDRMMLPDETEVEVIGVHEHIGTTWAQVVMVGNIWD
ncbi:hypothetical protein [Nocardioides aurantiacus]|uniref:Uncharacterized protein n=1 Tax=Nocardioides aurantiacus TaxID=86796 RepID=A0A3N2CTZ1_9ACTN|nr:hypothetical protein [Nocardioides aurantiacus]ROR91000.1 hypothetical protein EDD33_1858 [Nocardioides aurantiacus]